MTAPAERVARCSCGALTATATGEPVSVAMCSCSACQRRTGSAFAYSSFWKVEQVTHSGEATCWSRTSARGRTYEQFFCPICGTVLWSRGGRPGIVNIAAGCFVDKGFPAPGIAVWHTLRHDWIDDIADIPSQPEQPG